MFSMQVTSFGNEEQVKGSVATVCCVWEQGNAGSLDRLVLSGVVREY